MLPHHARVDRDSFEKAWKKSKSFHGVLATVRYTPERTTTIACIVSKKIAKSSPHRHRIKRRVYSLLEGSIANIPTGTYLVYPKKELLRSTADQLAADIGSTIQHIAHYAKQHTTK